MKTEKELSEELGMDRRVVREIRTNALSASSWTKEGNAIVYTEEGEHALRNQIQKELCSQELSDPEPEPVEREFVITRVPLNSTLLMCGDTKVRVSDNKNFMKGMVVKARPPAGEGRVWVMKGRCPRWRGKY